MHAAAPAASPAPDFRALLLVAPVWLAAGAAAWMCFRVAGGPALRGPGRWGLWLVAVALAVFLGSMLDRRVRPVSASRDAAVAVAVGWGIAVAAGWFFDVQVGGPFMGMVTAIVLGAAARPVGYRWGRVAVVLSAGLVGTAAGLQLSGGRGTPIGLAAAVLGGLLAVFAAAVALRVPLARGKVALLTSLWGAAWYAAWALTSALLPAAGMLLVLSAEVALALLLGGIVTALLERRPAAAAAAILGAVVAVGASLVVDAVLGSVFPSALLAGSGRETYLDVGNVVGLYLAAPIVMAPLLQAPLPVPAANR